MTNPTEGCFIGTMLPRSFLDDFLDEGVALPPTPNTDFTKVFSDGDDTHDICTSFVSQLCLSLIGLPSDPNIVTVVLQMRAVKKSRLLPGLRLFVARTKKRWNEKTYGRQEGSEATGATVDMCPTMTVRKEPTVRRKRGKSTTTAEYYNFATSLLGIEIRRAPEADPFTEPEDYESSRASPSSGGTPNSPPSSSSKAVPPSPPSVSRAGLPTSHQRSDVSPERMQQGEPHQRPDSQTSSSGPTHHPVERETEEGVVFRRSLVSHAYAQFARQHRTHFFQLILVDRWARFVRWDRSGAVVSSRFDYVLEPAFLCEFLWRFAHLSDERRGLDPTATLASRKEISLFEEAVKAFLSDMEAGLQDGRPLRHLPGAEKTLDPSETYPTWRVRVPKETSSGYMDLIIRRPFAGHSSLLGRATRAYIAYDLHEQRLVFMKDAWRIDHPKLQAESKTYGFLKQHGVPFVPELLSGGDVMSRKGKPQRTLTQTYAVLAEEWCRYGGSFERYFHHRVVQDIAYPLDSALDEREFLQAIHDSICGAWARQWGR